MKFVLLICIVFVSCRIGNSTPLQLQLNIGKIFGACPKVEGYSNSILENSDGEWYTHRVIGNSPWSYFRCPSSRFDFKSDNNVEMSSVKTQFLTPVLPVSFEVEGEIEKISDGEYEVNYKSALGNIPQKLVVLQNHGDSAIVWTCFDFKFFHLESVEMMTKSKVSIADSNKNMLIYKAQNILRQYGLSSKSFTEVDQKC